MTKKKSTPPPPKPKYLYLSYEETTTGGDYADDEEEGPFRNRSPRNRTVSFKALSRVQDKGTFFPSCSCVEVTDDVYASERVFLVIYRHRDGDTFGTSHGNWGVWASVKTDEEALRIRDDIESGALAKKGTYLPWEGYFNGLEGVEIHAFKVSDTVSGKPGVQYHY